MRRNRNMGRSNGGNLNMSGGPLLTEHLKDIDLELDLLKRKREMLEQQTQLFQPFNQPQRNFNQQPFYLLEPKQGGSHCDFSHLYSDGPQQYRKPFGKKRQSDSDWQNQSFPKRSAGNGPRFSNYTVPSNRNPKPFNTSNQQPKTTPFKHGQGKQSIGQKIANQKQHTQQRPVKNFVPTKITKPKAAAPPPNKIASKPVADRGNLVATAIKSAAEVENRDREALRLVADKVPTKQMTGRLELALGSILRDIKERCAESEHSEILRSCGAQRVMKHAIRERIRTAMLGKIVGKTLEITCEYRTMFPKETDIDIVNKALEANGLKPVNNTALGPIVPDVPVRYKPSEYYKENVTKLLHKYIAEMFDKLEDVYKKEYSEESKTPVATEEPAAVEVSQDNVTTEDSKETSVEEPQTITEDKNDVNVIANAETAKSAEVAAANGEVVKAQTGNELDAEFQEFLNSLNINQHEIRRMMPYLLKKHISTIVRLLNINGMYKEAISDITSTTKDLFVKQKFQPANPTPSKPIELYYVKVMGIPELPKRNQMHAFLRVFQPTSIKRHKTLRNLLFIGLHSQKDLDEIVKADGTVIAEMKLSIKVCDSNSGKPDDNVGSPMPANQETVENKQESKNDSISSNDLLGAELDEQITDLLTSIRNSEEYKVGEGDKISDEGEARGEGEARDESEARDEVEARDVGEARDEGEAPKEGNINEEGKIDNSSVKETTEPNENPADAADEPNALNTDEILDNIDDKPVETTNQNENTEDVEKSEISKNGGEAQPEKPKEEKPAAEPNTEKNDQVSELKTNASVKGTPTRASTRLASAPTTPSTIRTRRASKLLQ